MIFSDVFLAQNFKTYVLTTQKKSTFRMSAPSTMESSLVLLPVALINEDHFTALSTLVGTLAGVDSCVLVKLKKS